MRSIGSSKASPRERKRIGYSALSGPYNRSLRLLDDNDAEAFRLNQIAAETGMHDAVLAMGWFYLNGVGVAQDRDAALNWYRRSARQGEPKAMFSLGQIHYFEHDFAEALLWFGRAVEHGHNRSVFWIGKMHWRGQGVSADRKLAQTHFVRAASEKLPEAQRTVRFLAFIRRRNKGTK